MEVSDQLVKGPDIILNQLSKSLVNQTSTKGGRTVILDELSLTINSGEITTIFGPNGSGKTTLLNLLAGLVEPDQGTILIGNQAPFPGLATYAFQNFKDSLFPWRTVEGNLLFPLECQEIDSGEQQQRLKHFVEEFELKIPLSARIYELSVGQQQLVSLARALIGRPQLLLMDEPFSALDFNTRHLMQEKLFDYWNKSGATILAVSHDIDEAIFLGHRVILCPPHPVTEVEEIRVRFPFPRSRDIMYTKDYFDIRSEILKFFNA